MIKIHLAIGLLVCFVAGCTSFRTTALYRFNNDSVAPECNNQKLKGLPVKLKVPSHVRVVIFEQQLILANSPDEIGELKAAANEAAAEVRGLKAEIKSIISTKASSNAAFEKAIVALSEATTNRNNATTTADIEKTQIELERATVAHAVAKEMSKVADERATLELPKKEIDLSVATQKAELALANVDVGYRIVSFSPAQLNVKTTLEYTDKVFLVDFRRPAGGILDLKEASMDDEQYFANIQAEVTERTMADVNTAIDTIQGALTPAAPAVPNKATPTSANTPAGEAAPEVDFQESVVATQSFDISEPDWEARMMAFVNERLSPGAGPQSHEFSEYSEGSTQYGVTTVPAEPGMSVLPMN